MKSQADVIYYSQEFIVLSNPLLDSQRLTPSTRNNIFWRAYARQGSVTISNNKGHQTEVQRVKRNTYGKRRPSVAH